MTVDGVEQIEEARLRSLHRLDILDTIDEAEFDHITKLAARLTGAPIAAVSFIDAKRQWIKSRVGVDACEVARDIAFCGQTILGDEALEICDASKDPRFADNPLVTGPPHVRYYAGSPLITAGGHRVGALCIVDTIARPPMSADTAALLDGLAKIVVDHLALRRSRAIGRVATLIAETTSDAVICADTRNRITYWNTAAARMLGWTAEEAIGQTLDLIVPEHLRARHAGGLARVAAGGIPRLFGKIIELPACRRDGREIPIELSLGTWSDEGGSPAGFAAIVRDVSDRKALEAERHRTQALLDTVIEAMPVMLFVKDAEDGRYTLVNRTFEALTKLSRDTILGRTDAELFSSMNADVFVENDRIALAARHTVLSEETLTRSDGSTIVVRSQKLGIDPDGNDMPRYVLGISEDVTESRAAQDRLRHLACHDGLTGLANRTNLTDRLTAMLEARSGPIPCALLCIDIDRFKIVNDLYGHGFGDEVLVELAKRLEATCGDDALVARLGGDEFAVLCECDADGSRATMLAKRIVDSVKAPIMLSGRVAHLDASLGVAISPADGSDASDLLRNADMALYRSKAEGPGTISFFDVSMDRAVHRRRMIEAELRTAIAEKAIVPVYQPIMCLERDQIVTFEVLARWHHPSLGDVSPDSFISVAEESGLIVELGRQILTMAATEAQRWSVPLKIAVNLSPVQLLSGDFAKDVVSVLAMTGLDPTRLILEVTEGFLIRDTTRAIDILKRLKAIGCQISMDDFGTGYSSLSYFRRFPFDKVKIDQSFIRDMARDQQARAIVQAVIGLGRGLGLSVVAEGVEDESQIAMLRAEGCSQVQGYLLGRPSPIETFEHIVRAKPAIGSLGEDRIAAAA
ncbi:sensor domain-containing phosphodiesterase [Sphingomonas sp. CLY1604]|uniref:sensor domain-containing phosphodiesterase n=1 Tax=Sphingomonas sp. CLY1604 TaxID=3457786 RepID=UPI003FD8EDE3